MVAGITAQYPETRLAGLATAAVLHQSAARYIAGIWHRTAQPRRARERLIAGFSERGEADTDTEGIPIGLGAAKTATAWWKSGPLQGAAHPNRCALLTDCGAGGANAMQSVGAWGRAEPTGFTFGHRLGANPTATPQARVAFGIKEAAPRAVAELGAAAAAGRRLGIWSAVAAITRLALCRAEAAGTEDAAPFDKAIKIAFGQFGEANTLFDPQCA